MYVSGILITVNMGADYLQNRYFLNFQPPTLLDSRSLWPCSLRRRSAVVRLLASRVQIPPREWMLVSCVCCVGSGLCDELITRSEESYSECVCVYVCDLETSTARRPGPYEMSKQQTS
jgi:hypothetical protein